ncbi:hypothetical protein J6590_040092 [Homalodisca vitripennis]|nr:hypothetical protein J6590_040092 [Homalodisca vitripennis]
MNTWGRGGYDRVKGTLKKINLFSREQSLFPLQPKGQRERAIDSLGHPRTKEMRVMLEFQERNATEKKILFYGEIWMLCNTPDECPKQRNATDCGAFVCAYAELLSERKISQEDFRTYGKAGDRIATERVVAVAEEDVIVIRELSEAIRDSVPASSGLPLPREEEVDIGRDIVLSDLMMEETAEMTPRVNTPTDEQKSSWLSIAASETWDMVEDQNCSTSGTRMSAPAAEPRTPTSGSDDD